ncbi:SCO1860 family LAETG-anchored protein [Streptomyces sp. NRRL WC-3742]|uniref:SCO1860 family LAETG-anchored protein n=1 Tax=Streptomyces sp. NRRL WC-3742 TaxID=1463934 RepID=UPI0004C6569C|nr:SCO1860 family LAETG-anchored protein [Streptomyces sp. NRRL WC-3742]
MSSRRIVSASAAVVVSTLLTAAPVQAEPAPSTGKARAVTAELALDVKLLNNAVDVPVNLALNKVETPEQRDGAVLTAAVDGVDQRRPVTLVKAEVGRSVTRVDAKGAVASVKLVNADVNAPGLATALLGVEAMSAEATCPVDGQPTANVVAPAKLTVLGKSVTLGLYGPTKVDVPAVGSVSVEFSKKTTTTTTAAATALEVRVEVNPLNLNVAKVSGTVTVASVSCEKPAGSSVTPSTAPTTAPSAKPAADVTTAARATASRAPEHLATTGGSSATGPLAAGAAALVAGGAAALWATRRRRARRH